MGMKSIAALVLCAAAARANAAELMSYEQFSKVKFEVPQVTEYHAGTGALLLIGVRHTWDAHDAQIAEIERQWRRFTPSVAYFEGNGWAVGQGFADTVQRLGEPGLVRFLAQMDRVPVAALEPDFADEIAALQHHWSDEQIKVFYTLRPVATNANSPSADDVAGYLTGAFPTHPGVHGPPETLAELRTSTAKLLGVQDWRKAQAAWFDPLSSGRYTNEMARASGNYRDEYMLRVLTARVKAGDRVFAVVGAAHSVMQAPVLHAELHGAAK